MGDTVTNELLRCPFCGEEPRLGVGSSCEDPQVMCDMCRSSGPECGDEAEAVAAWNRRSATAELVAVKPLEWTQSRVFGSVKRRGSGPFGEWTAFDVEGLTEEQIRAKELEANERHAACIRSALASPTVSDEMVERAATEDAIKDAIVAGWNACRKSIYAVCEDMQEKPFSDPAKTGPLRGLGPTPRQQAHSEGFNGGWKHAAKSIARGFNAMEALDDDNVRAALLAALGGQHD